MKKRYIALLVVGGALTSSLVAPPAKVLADSSIIPNRVQIVEKIDSQTPILDGKFVMVTYSDDTIDPDGKIEFSQKRQSILPAIDGKSVDTTPVQVQTISGRLATVLVPTQTLDDQITKMAQSSNIVRILTVGGTAIEDTPYAKQKGFHFSLGGMQYDIPWNGDDAKLIGQINDTHTQKAFTDVESGRWSEGAIYTLVNDAIVHGVGDGQFAPSAPVTRAAFLTMLAGTVQNAGFDLSKKETAPSDTVDWAKDPTSKIKAYLDGVESGSFDAILGSQKNLKPNQAITRAEAAQIMAFFVTGEGSGNWTFTDWDGGAQKGRVSRLIDVGGISGTGDGKFSPNVTLTREQMASMAARLLFVN